MEQVIFYVFATLLVFSAGLVITVRNPVHAALFLVLSFFCCAAIWLLLQAEFLAIALILVYVGAVMVLFLFVVMMLDINLAPLREGFARFLPVGLLFAVLMLLAMGLIVGSDDILSGIQYGPGLKEEPAVGNTHALGRLLFTEYLYPFEIAGAVLLVAIVAAISLTMRQSRHPRTPKPERQVQVKSKDRVRLVDMPSEDKQK
ncbi:MAG: NADH-quinone oxidoreductase subunit J [Gammaproteobacteria bacterium]